jgi:tRNA (guanosine-2'-O-)-methyltransferase
MNEALAYSQKCEMYKFLCEFITGNRVERFNDVSDKRTRHITVVLEDIYQPHNTSAVLRSCDCFGIQDVHIIENKNEYTVNPDIALGSSNWLTLYKYNETENNTLNCINKLKQNGYSIIASSPHLDDSYLEEFDIHQRSAILFGTEKDGLSDIALQHADKFVKIPMYGFTESFNISVSVALTLYALSQKLRNSNLAWQLNEEEILDLKIEWAKISIKKSELIVEQFMQRLNK